VWARRLMDRIKHESGRIKDTMLGRPDASKPVARAPAPVEEPGEGSIG